MNDLTVVYITANVISDYFRKNTQGILVQAIGELPLIVVSHKPTIFRENTINILAENMERSHVNIYRQALLGVKQAKTKYIAIAEDDILYSKDHFQKRPKRLGVFAYNIACWSIYTWSKPSIFSYTGRRNHGMLICERDLYIEAMEERFAKFTDDTQIKNKFWAEPGKYERQLGVTVRKTDIFYTDPANIMFSHPEGLSMNTLGKRKRLAPIRAFRIPYWEEPDVIMRYYDEFYSE